MEEVSYPSGLRCSREILLKAATVMKKTLTFHPKDEAA
jgi:hypothetical protein